MTADAPAPKSSASSTATGAAVTARGHGRSHSRDASILAEAPCLLGQPSRSRSLRARSRRRLDRVRGRPPARRAGPHSTAPRARQDRCHRGTSRAAGRPRAWRAAPFACRRLTLSELARDYLTHVRARSTTVHVTAERMRAASDRDRLVEAAPEAGSWSVEPRYCRGGWDSASRRDGGGPSASATLCRPRTARVTWSRVRPRDQRALTRTSRRTSFTTALTALAVLTDEPLELAAFEQLARECVEPDRNSGRMQASESIYCQRRSRIGGS